MKYRKSNKEVSMAASKDAPASGGDIFSLIGQAFQMIEASWEALKLNIVTFILVALAPFLAILAAVITSSVIFTVSIINNADSANSTISGFAWALSWLLSVIALVVALIFLPAITVTQLASAKGKKISFGEAFEQGKKYILRYIGIALLVGLIIGVPLILSFLLVFIIIGILLVPLAIAWAIAFAFFMALAPYILIDKDKGVVDTMKLSYEITKKNWKWVLAVYVVLWVIGLPSVIPYIGGIISAALSIAYFCLLPIVYVKHIKH